MDDSKSKILRASLVLFGTKGFSDTTTKEIAKQSGLSEGTIFNHFKDKASIFQQVVETYASQPLVELEQVEKKLHYRNFCDDLYQLATAYVEMIFSRVHILRIVMQNKTSATPRSPHRQLAVLWELCDHFQGCLARAAEAGLIEARDYATEADLFVCHITRIVLFAAAGEQTFTMTAELKKKLFAEMARSCPAMAEELFDCHEAPAALSMHA
jgi:Transcriptional regulator